MSSTIFRGIGSVYKLMLLICLGGGISIFNSPSYGLGIQSFGTTSGGNYYNFGSLVQVTAVFYGDQMYGGGDYHITIRCTESPEDVLVTTMHIDPDDEDSTTWHLTVDSCNIPDGISTLHFTATITDDDDNQDDCSIVVNIVRISGVLSYVTYTGAFDDYTEEADAVAVNQRMCFKPILIGAYPGYSAGLNWINATSVGYDRAEAIQTTPQWVTVTAYLNTGCWVVPSASRRVAWVKATLSQVTLGANGNSFARVMRDDGVITYGGEEDGLNYDWAVNDNRGYPSPVPVQYKVGSKPRFDVVFTYDPPDWIGSIYYTGEIEFNIPKTTGTAGGNGVSYAVNMVAESSFPDTVQTKVFDQDFYFSLALGFVQFAGSSSHKAYLTLNNPQPERHTIVNLACDGISDPGIGTTDIVREDWIFNSIWGKFTDLNMSAALGEPPPVDPNLPTVFKYAHDGGYGGYPYVATANGLLKYGYGECGAWQQLLIRVYDIHGFTTMSAAPVLILPSEVSGHIKRPDDHPLPPLVGYWVMKAFSSKFGNGQGNGAVAESFICHKVCKINNKLYDPSYGVACVTSGSWADNKYDYEASYIHKFLFGDSGDETRDWVSGTDMGQAPTLPCPYLLLEWDK